MRLFLKICDDGHVFELEFTKATTPSIVTVVTIHIKLAK